MSRQCDPMLKGMHLFFLFNSEPCYTYSFVGEVSLANERLAFMVNLPVKFRVLGFILSAMNRRQSGQIIFPTDSQQPRKAVKACLALAVRPPNLRHGLGLNPDRRFGTEI